MKASKIYSVILLFTSLTLFTGCSDSITSNAEQDKSTNIVSYRNDEITFISKYNLNPGECICIDSTVSFMKYITAYSISDCNIAKKEMFISASNIDQCGSLPCKVDASENYYLYDLTIENLSDRTLSIFVIMEGGSISD